MTALLLFAMFFVTCWAIIYANVTRANARDDGRRMGYEKARKELRAKLEEQITERAETLIEQGFVAGAGYVQTGKLPEVVDLDR